MADPIPPQEEPDPTPPPPLLLPEEEEGPTIQAQLDSTLRYILDDIIRLPSNSVMYHQEEIFELLDLITMKEKDIADITGLIKGKEVKISKHNARLLLHFVWWHHDLSSQMLNNTFDQDLWFNMDCNDFTKFRHTKVPSIASSGSSKAPSIVQDGDVGADTVLQFQKSIKMEISQYPEFKGSLEGWLPFKRKLKAITATHGIDRVIADNPDPIMPDTQDYRLYQMQNNFLYSVFTQKLHGGAAIIAMCNYEESKDARRVYLSLQDHYESTSNLMVISQKCHAKIQSLKLTCQFCRGAQAFVTQLQNAFLDLEYCTGTEKNDLEKKTTLLLAIEDTNYHAIRDNLAMDSDKSYLDSLAAIDQHATMFIPNNYRKPPRQANTNCRA